MFYIQGDFNFENPTWKTISLSAKDLISRLLSVETYKRPTASDVWLMSICIIFLWLYWTMVMSYNFFYIICLFSLIDLICKQLLKHPWVIGDSAKEELMDSEVVTKLQRFNARRKLRAAAIASVLSSKVALRTKRLKSLLGSNDLTTEEIENLRLHFKRM